MLNILSEGIVLASKFAVGFTDALFGCTLDYAVV